ncbi:hypothetical protein C8J56DRAFT_1091546 [Mycena floridula]|nr:hypothetical protein C8J56DRAFT_1091546 [Mycena floridula]
MSSSPSQRSSSPVSIDERLVLSDLHLSQALRANTSLKRQLEEQEASEKAKKPKRDTVGRNIGKLICLDATRIIHLVREGDRCALEEFNAAESRENGEPEPEPEDESRLTPAKLKEKRQEELQRQRDKTGFQLLCDLVSGFMPLVESGDRALIMARIKELNNDSKQARGDEINRIRDDLAGWLMAEFECPFLQSKTRVGRGWKGSCPGRLLFPCNIDYDDEETRAKVFTLHPDFRINGNFFCNTFYPGGQGDPEDMEDQWLKGFLLVWLANKHVDLGENFQIIKAIGASDLENKNPNAEVQQKTKKRGSQSVADIVGLSSVTPRSIAYAGVMLHFNLTDATSWSLSYNGVSYFALYNAIVDYFETPKEGTPEALQAKELLIWWNRAIFPQGTPAELADTSSFRDELAAMRAKKAAKLEAAAQEAARVKAANDAAAAVAAPATAAAAPATAA